jgi:acetoacetate decarboxylase
MRSMAELDARGDVFHGQHCQDVSELGGHRRHHRVVRRSQQVCNARTGMFERVTRRLSRARRDLGLAVDLARFGDFTYRGAQYLSATLEVDPDAIRPFLPTSLRLADPPRADLFCAFFPDCSFGAQYREAGLFVHVRTGSGVGIHCPWMIVDDDVALILGRELLGYPKKLGEVTWSPTDDTITAEASRKGHELIRMHARLGERIADPPPFLGRPHRNVVGLLGLAWPRLIAFRPRETPVQVREVDVDLQISGSEADPLHEMGLGPVQQARLHTVNIAAGLGVPIVVRPVAPTFLLRRLRPRVL